LTSLPTGSHAESLTAFGRHGRLGRARIVIPFGHELPLVGSPGRATDELN